MLKKLIIGFVVLALLAAAGFLSLPLLLDKNKVKDEFVASFKALTGLDMQVQGDMAIERFPVPHIVANSMFVHNAPGAQTPFLLTIKVLDIQPSLPSLLLGRLVVQNLKIDGMKIELERMKDDKMNWESAAPAGKSASGDLRLSPIFQAASVTLVDGNLRYVDSLADSMSEYKDINLIMSNGGLEDQSTFKMKFAYKKRAIGISGSLGRLSEVAAKGAVPAKLAINSRDSHIKYDGMIGWKENHYTLQGKAHLETDDVVPLVNLWMGYVEKEDDNKGIYKPLPLKADTDVTMQGDKVLLPNLVLDGAIIKGKAEVGLSKPSHIDIKATLDLLDLESLFGSTLFTDHVLQNSAADADKDSYAIPEKSFFDRILLSTDLTCKDILYNQHHIKDSHFAFDLSGGEMTISEAIAVLPGESRIVFTGIGKEGFQGFSLEGQLDALGENFSEMIGIFKAKGFAIPPEDFRRFRIKSNAVVSAKEVRLSELAARIENMGIVGGIVAKLGERIQIDAALRIGGLNLDHFTTLWGLESWKNNFLDNTPSPKTEAFLSRWLKDLGYDLKLNASIESWILNGKTRDKTDFSMSAGRGQLSFKDVKTFYNNSEISGDIALNVLDVLPHIDINILADGIDADSFFNSDGQEHPEPAPVKSERWSHNEFDLHWLDTLTSNFHFRMGRFKSGNLRSENIDLRGTIGSRSLTIDSLSAEAFGGHIASKIIVNGGKIPALNMVANVVSIDTAQLAALFPILSEMTGKYNMSIGLSTNGINTYSWISNMEGTVGIGARDVTIHDFNLPGIITSVGYVRTVADILNVVKRAFPGGNTVLSSIEGQWLVSGGVLKTSTVKITVADSVGVLTGMVDILNWRVQDQIVFALKALDPVHPPTIVILFSGDLDKPEKGLDTRSLEEYVTNKTSQHMLNQYGTH